MSVSCVLTTCLGNVDYGSWFNLDGLNFVQDVDAIFDAIDSACHKVGPDRCALWAPSPAAVQERRAGVLSSLKKTPLVIPAWSRDSGPEMPELVTYSKLQGVTRGLIYSPLGKVVQLTQVYAALEAGDPLPFYDLKIQSPLVPTFGDMCAVDDIDAGIPLPTGAEVDAFPAIMCSDSVPMEDTPDEYAEYTEKIQGVSKWMGAANAIVRSACIGRTVRPKWRFSEGMPYD